MPQRQRNAPANATTGSCDNSDFSAEV
jgi:hypothetical protein